MSDLLTHSIKDNFNKKHLEYIDLYSQETGDDDIIWIKYNPLYYTPDTDTCRINKNLYNPLTKKIII